MDKGRMSSQRRVVNNSREIAITLFAIIVSGIASVMLSVEVFGIWWEGVQKNGLLGSIGQMGFILIMIFMLYGCFVYLLTRLGYLQRQKGHHDDQLQDLEAVYSSVAPSLAILIPSYKEDPHVIRKTLLSAALLDYPSRQVVLLIDNPPQCTSHEEERLLSDTRLLAEQIHDMMDAPAHHYLAEYNAFIARSQQASIDTVEELSHLATLYNDVAQCLNGWSETFPVNNHEDKWFVENILNLPAKEHTRRANQLQRASKQNPAAYNNDGIEREYCRLSRLFRVEITNFERKRFENLSQEPNKAMNLNSYIGLMGNRYQQVQGEDGAHLVLGGRGDARYVIPDAEFIITLDADSLLHSNYALQLVSVMQQPGNERYAVVQTPYSAFPGAIGALERTAGATTDIQYIVHQGFTRYNATFWVGANALIRKIALEDIKTITTERGFNIIKFVQDRTVIEDTESTVDLVDRSWQLYNYPKRLAYSATPPDFGSLLIQRRRWANGGLIILPKLLRYLVRPKIPKRMGHGFMGIHYLSSIAGLNIGILFLLTFPFEAALRNAWLPLATLPYFTLYTRDLMQCGYRIREMLNVYALNLVLLPVNLGGVFKSINQIVTGRRTPFGRTPKIVDRTATPVLYLAAVYGLFAYCAVCFITATNESFWGSAIFAGVNACMLAYAIIRFIGFKETWEDILVAIRRGAGQPPMLPPENIVSDLPHDVSVASEKQVG